MTVKSIFENIILPVNNFLDIEKTIMKDILIPLIAAIGGVIAGATSTWLLQRANRKRFIREQIAALHFEIESNHKWADNILNSLNYLRDEAWVAIKNAGLIQYLDPKVRMMIPSVYDAMHALNQRIKNARELSGEDLAHYIVESEEYRQSFLSQSKELLSEWQI